MLKLARFLKPYASLIALSISLLFAQAYCDLTLPDIMSQMVNKGIANNDLNYILSAGLEMLGVALLGAICSIIVGYFSAKVAAASSKDIRRSLFMKVQSFSSAEMDHFSAASLITRTTNDITQIQTFSVMFMRLMIYAPIIGIGGIIKALTKSVSMSWVIALAVIVMLGMISVVFSVALPKFRVVQKLIDRLNQIVRENLSGILIVRAFNTQKHEEKRFDIANKDLTSTNLFINRVMTTMMPMMFLVMNLTTVLIVWVGSHKVSEFSMQVGDMMAYIQYGMQIIFAFLMISMMFIMVPRASVSANRISEVLETELSIEDPEEPKSWKAFEGTVEFRNVCFRFPGAEKDALHDISFVARPGETTAFIGATGSGKSTLVNLIPRLYDATNGRVLVGGIDVKEADIASLRDKIGFVPQKGVLFSGTIESNLRYAKQDAVQDDLDRSAQIAQAAEFISSKSEGYETSIAQGGTNVSGGQKQRIAIARALMKQAPINIFDDSFSALDFKTDSALRKALHEKMASSTVLVVAQRISTIMTADQIIVLDKGTIAGKGTHDELIRDCEVYREIAYSQLSKEELAK